MNTDPSAAGILVVDDDMRLCRLLRRYLQEEGFRARIALNGAEMRRLMALEPPALVLLDLMLPGEDGFSLARELRASSEVAIIMLTAREDTVDKVVGLELGADDYVTKPFDSRELLARMRSVLRRKGKADGASRADKGTLACFAGWRLDLGAYELTAPDGHSVSLTANEFHLLVALVERCNRVMSRDDITELIAEREWTPDDRSVDVLVGKLRRKLADDAHAPRLIHTVRGVGYKLSASVDYR